MDRASRSTVPGCGTSVIQTVPTVPGMFTVNETGSRSSVVTTVEALAVPPETSIPNDQPPTMSVEAPESISFSR